MKKEETIDYQIKSAWHAISRMYNQHATKYDITVSIGYVLLSIDVKKGTAATKIPGKIGLEAKSLSRLLKSIEKIGLIYKEVDENDRRSIRIFLTEAGVQKREQAKEVVNEFNHQIYDSIASDKLKTFFEVIRRINHLLETKTI